MAGIVLMMGLALVSCTEIKAGFLVAQADSALNNGNFEKAESLYQKIIVLQPDVAEHHWKLGTVYISRNRKTKAEEQIKILRAMKRDDLADQLVHFLRAQPQ